MLRSPTAVNSTSHDIVAFLYEELEQERAARAELQQQLQNIKAGRNATSDRDTPAAYTFEPPTARSAATAACSLPTAPAAALHPQAVQNYATAPSPLPAAAAAEASLPSIIPSRSRCQLLHELQQAADNDHWPHINSAATHQHHHHQQQQQQQRWQQPHTTTAAAAAAASHAPMHMPYPEPIDHLSHCPPLLRVPTPHPLPTRPAAAVTPLTTCAHNSSNARPLWPTAASSSSSSSSMRCDRPCHPCGSSSRQQYKYATATAAAEVAVLSREAAEALDAAAAAMRDRNNSQLLQESALTSSSGSGSDGEDNPVVTCKTSSSRDADHEHYVRRWDTTQFAHSHKAFRQQQQQQPYHHHHHWRQQQQQQQLPFSLPQQQQQQQQQQWQHDEQDHSDNKPSGVNTAAEADTVAAEHASLQAKPLGDASPDVDWEQEIDSFCTRLDQMNEVKHHNPRSLGFAQGNHPQGVTLTNKLPKKLARSETDYFNDGENQEKKIEVGNHGELQLANAPAKIHDNANASTEDDCSHCEHLKEQLLECEFEREFAAAQLAMVIKERDVLALERQSLLDIMMVCRHTGDNTI